MALLRIGEPHEGGSLLPLRPRRARLPAQSGPAWPCPVRPCLALPGHTKPSPACLDSHARPCLALSFPACLTLSDPALPGPVEPSQATPARPCRAEPGHAKPCRALPDLIPSTQTKGEDQISEVQARTIQVRKKDIFKGIWLDRPGQPQADGGCQSMETTTIRAFVSACCSAQPAMPSRSPPCQPCLAWPVLPKPSQAVPLLRATDCLPCQVPPHPAMTSLATTRAF
jgi:hypothetical protein